MAHQNIGNADFRVAIRLDLPPEGVKDYKSGKTGVIGF
jgi:hypothetical protein